MPVSTAAIITRGGKILLAQRLPCGSMASRWEFPGGKSETDELPAEALLRELWEEFRVSAEVRETLGAVKFKNEKDYYTLIAFRVELEEEPTKLYEHTQIGWFSLEELEQLNLADSDRTLLAHIKPQLRL